MSSVLTSFSDGLHTIWKPNKPLPPKLAFGHDGSFAAIDGLTRIGHDGSFAAIDGLTRTAARENTVRVGPDVPTIVGDPHIGPMSCLSC